MVQKKVVFLFVMVALISCAMVYARKKGNIHYKANCENCSCKEFVSDADSNYKCYNCGHADYLHIR